MEETEKEGNTVSDSFILEMAGNEMVPIAAFDVMKLPSSD